MCRAVRVCVQCLSACLSARTGLREEEGIREARHCEQVAPAGVQPAQVHDNVIRLGRQREQRPRAVGFHAGTEEGTQHHHCDARLPGLLEHGALPLPPEPCSLRVKIRDEFRAAAHARHPIDELVNVFICGGLYDGLYALFCAPV